MKTGLYREGVKIYSVFPLSSAAARSRKSQNVAKMSPQDIFLLYTIVEQDGLDRGSLFFIISLKRMQWSSAGMLTWIDAC